MHIREYMDVRGQLAKVTANREKALFLHFFNKTRERGYTVWWSNLKRHNDRLSKEKRQLT